MHKFIRALGLIVGISLLFVLDWNIEPVHAANFTVSDEAGLVAAINAANANSDIDIIELTADINLATTTPYNFNGNTGLPTITQPLVIRGNGYTIRRTSATPFRLLGVNNTQLQLENLTLAKGYFYAPPYTTQYGGGAIYAIGSNAQLIGKQLTVGGSVENQNYSMGSGGGISIAGQLILIDSLVSHNFILAQTPAGGGGIYIGANTFQSAIIDSLINNNTANLSPHVSGSSGGAGIYVVDADLDIIGSDISSNSASSQYIRGVGIHFRGNGSLQINNSTISYNTSFTAYDIWRLWGGGLYVEASLSSKSVVRNTEVFENDVVAKDAYGGGIYANNLTIEYSSIYNNRIRSNDNQWEAQGGGVMGTNLYVLSTSITNNRVTSLYTTSTSFSGAAGISLNSGEIINTTISGNTAIHGGGSGLTQVGGGVNASGNTNIINSTIVNNTVQDSTATRKAGGVFFGTGSATVNVANTIIMNNRAIVSGVESVSSCARSGGSPAVVPVSQGYNLVESEVGCNALLNAASDIRTTISFEPLANNGALTLSHAISTIPPVNSGNPSAINSSPFSCIETDQRGAPRDSQCDIGAYEAGAIVPPANPSPVAGNDLFETIINTTLQALVTGNDSDSEHGLLRYFNSNFPFNGSLAFHIDGTFAYTPVNGFIGTDTFSYIVCNSSGNCSEAVVSILVNDIPSLPLAPQLSLDSLESFNVDLSWVDNSSDETSFIIERRDNGTSWTFLDSTEADAIIFSDLTVSCEYPYDYRVRAYRASDGAYSAPSNVVSAITLICPSPSNLTATSTGYESIQLTWEDTLQDETNFVLERSEDNGENWTIVTTPNANITYYADINLWCGINYQYRVKSERTNPALTTTYSSVASAATSDCPTPPIAPTGLRVVNVSYDSIRITWNSSPYTQTYEVQVSGDGGQTFNVRALTTKIDITSTSVTCGNTYQYRVRVYRTNPTKQYSEFSNTIVVSTWDCLPPPNPPSDLALTVTGANSISLTWVDTNTDESSYRIERWNSIGNSWSEIGLTYANGTSTINTNLTCAITYQYRVRAQRNYPQLLYSVYSEVVSVTLPCPPPPYAPSDLQATNVGYRTLDLSWIDNSNDEYEFRIERSMDGLAWTQIASPSSNVTTRTITNLTCSTTYFYRVYAYRNTPNYNSDYSNILEVNTQACPIMPAPTLSGMGTDTTIITLNWNDSSANETNYRFMISVNGGVSFGSVSTYSYITDTSVAITGLFCNRTYQFYIYPYNSDANYSGDSSNIITATTKNCAPPVAPSNLSATPASPTSVLVSWTDNATDETNFRIERSLSGTGGWTLWNSPSANSTSYQLISLNCATTYYFRANAQNGTGQSGYSNIASATTLNCPSATPTSLTTSTRTTASISLSWVDNATDETEYRLERSLSSSISWTEIAQLAASSTNYADSRLNCGTSYLYRVRAYRQSDGVYSNYSSNLYTSTLTCPPRPSTPSNVTVTPNGTNAININWTDNATTETNYRIERTNNSGSSWVIVADIAANSTSYTDSTIVCNDNYSYRVSAFINTDNVFSFTTSSSYLRIPCAPSNLRLGISSQTAIILNWDDTATGETGYRVERSNDGGVTWLEIGTTAANAISYSNTSLACTSEYQYRVRAYVSTGSVYSAYSTVLTASTQDCQGITEATCTLAQFDTSHHIGNTLGPVYMSADGSRVGLNYQDVGSVGVSGIYLYDIATETLLADFQQSWWGDISADGQQFVFKSVGNHTSQNADGNEEIFYWDNGVYTQLSNTTGNMQLGQPQLSDDGTTVVFSGAGAVVGISSSYNFIYIWDAVNGLRRLINNPRTGSVSQPDVLISGDGSTIAFYHDASLSGAGGSNTSIYLWDASNGIRLLYPFNHDVENVVWGFDINYDGTRLVFADDGNPIGLNPDLSDEFFLWDAATGLHQLTETTIDGSIWSVSMDGSGNRILLTSALDLDPDDGNPTTSGYYLYDEGYGFSQISYIQDLGSPTIGDALSADGLKLALIYPSGWNGIGDPFPYMKLFIATCTPADNLPAPDAINLSVNVDGNVDLSWADKSLGETEFSIERSIGGRNQWEEIDSVSANTTTYTDSNLGCSSNYDYRIRAYRGDDNHYSEYSAIASIAVTGCGMDAPSSLNITGVSQTSIGLAWTDNATDETLYSVERSDDGVSWVEISQLSADSEVYTNNSLSCGTVYDYRIRAYRADDSAFSDYSNVATGTTSLCDLVAPNGLNITGTSQTSISLAWTDNASDETNYRLERSLAGQNAWSEIAQLAANSSSYSDTSLSCATSYDYRVRGYRSADTSYSTYSNIATGSTSLCNLVAPSGLNITGTGETNINLSWTDNASDETNYRIERSLAGQNAWSEIAQVTANGTSYSNTSLACNTSYDYRVRGYRSIDTSYSTYSNVATGATTVCTTLNAPTNIQLTGSTAFGLSISWTDNSVNETSYEIERSSDGTNWISLGSISSDSTGYTDSGLFCQTGYQYRIRSYQTGTETYSPYGTSSVFTTATCPPLLASVLTVIGSSSNSINLSWTQDTATSFNLSYNIGGQWLPLGSFDRNTTSYTHSPLSCGQTVLYRVDSARQQDSATASSAILTVSVPACAAPIAPSAPSVLNTTSSMVTLQIPSLPTGASSMNLQRSLDGTNWQNLGVANTGSYMDTNVACGVAYQYRLVAFRASDGQVSVPSAIANAVTLPCPVPVSNVVGVFRNGLWSFVESNNTGQLASQFSFGDGQWQPLVGDWNGDGSDGIGLYRNGEFVLRSVVAGQMQENRFNFGDTQAGWQAIAGDWNGDGSDSIGLYKDGTFILSDDNSNESYRFNFGNGQAGWLPVVGDWDGNISDGVGLYKDGLWLLANSVHDPNGTSQSINYGPAQSGWMPVVGDWNADNIDTIGLYKDGLWRIRLDNNAGGDEISIFYGMAGDIPLAIFEGASSTLPLFGN